MGGGSFRLSLFIAASIGMAACATAQDDELTGGIFGPALSRSEMKKAIAAADAHPLGSERNPVRVSDPGGERAYLGRLRCSDGSAPQFERGGSVGIGPFGNILDVYGVRCATGTPPSSSVYMDMYHRHVEPRPVAGFTIVAP
jgi:hypothetical protein